MDRQRGVSLLLLESISDKHVGMWLSIARNDVLTPESHYGGMGIRSLCT